MFPLLKTQFYTPLPKKKRKSLSMYMSCIIFAMIAKVQDKTEQGLKHNDASLILIVAVFVLFALAGALVLGAMALCLQHGRGFEALIMLNPFQVKIGCN